MWKFFSGIINIALLVFLFIVVISLLEATISETSSWKAGRRIRWYLKNNNGWLAWLILVTVVVFCIALQKTLTSSSLKWEFEKEYRTNADFQNTITNAPSVFDGSRLQKFSEGKFDTPKPTITTRDLIGYRDKKRPTNLIWWLRFFVLLHLLPLMILYAYSDETAVGIKAAIERHRQRIEEQKNKPKDQKESGLTMFKVFMSDISAETLKLFAESFSLFGRGK